MPTSQASRKPETKRQFINLSVSAKEKVAARFVAAALGQTDHSLLLRTMNLTEITVRADHIAAGLGFKDLAAAMRNVDEDELLTRARGIGEALKA